MDLFGDLPDPSGCKGAVTSGSGQYDEETVSKKAKQENAEKTEPLKRGLDSGDSAQNGKIARQKLSYKYKLCGYHAERKGEREDMQDAFVIIENFTQKFPDLHPSIHRLALFAVYDGHGGARASKFAADHLHNHLIHKFPKVDVSQAEKEIKKVLVETFKKTDEEFLKEATKSKPVWKDGTTATVILFINDTAFIASLGDSQAFLCRQNDDKSYLPIHLTAVHNPSVYEERMRIQKAGGQVKDGRVMGVLEVSRSIGDGQFKKHGVTCIPDVKKCQLTDNDKYIVLACDGLWKTFTAEECIKFTNTNLNIKDESNGSPEDLPYNDVCGKLAGEAVLRLSADNVTVILISVEKIS